MLTVGVRQGRAFASVGGATRYWFCPGCVLAALVVVLNCCCYFGNAADDDYDDADDGIR